MCLYEMVPSPNISCDLRTGGTTIEYNPEHIAEKSLSQFTEELELELCRILLRHPYRKKPQAFEDIWYKASTITITQKGLEKKQLKKNQSIEYYYKKLLETEELEANMSMANGNAHCNNPKESQEQNENQPQNKITTENTEITENGPTDLWQEDSVVDSKVQQFIQQNLNREVWGELPGNLQFLLQSQFQDFQQSKMILKYFKNSAGSNSRILTRMKPNRRTAFMQMGSRYKPEPGKILIALDTSESVSNDNLMKFYGLIKSIWAKGFKKIDVVQFDMKVHEDTLQKFHRQAFYKIKGRGGTSFQPVIEYAENQTQKYDGLIILTDGFASQPRISKNKGLKILWMLTTYSGYQSWMKLYGVIN